MSQIVIGGQTPTNYLRVQLPAGDTTVIQVGGEYTCIAEIVKIVEEKKLTTFQNVSFYVILKDGQKIPVYEEQIISEYYKTVEKLLLGLTDD